MVEQQSSGWEHLGGESNGGCILYTLSSSETEALGPRHAVPMSTSIRSLGTSPWVTLFCCSSSSSKVTNTLEKGVTKDDGKMEVYYTIPHT